MNKWIVVTTINPPTKAIERISALVRSSGWRCIVVGDRKTPDGWRCDGIDYLSYDDQQRRYGALSTLLPANHYCRKNIGYLYAAEHGADVILETDDDNIPGEGFGAEPQRRLSADVVGDTRWANVYGHFTDRLIWPRGNPLDTVHTAGRIIETGSTVDAPVQQFLADGDPDVDAIYRLLFKEPLDFSDRPPVALARGTWCAFNSQNTLFFRDAFDLLYLPCHVSFRMTDIWRSFVAQAALWAGGKQVVFRSATVVQERNQHDLMKDFRDEVDGLLHNDRIARCLEQMLAATKSSEYAQLATEGWQRLLNESILQPEEIAVFAEWSDRMARTR